MAVRVILATDQNLDENTGVYSCEVRHIRRIDLRNCTNWTTVSVDNSGSVPRQKGHWPHIARAAVSVDEFYYCSVRIPAAGVSYSCVPVSEINMDDTDVEHTVLVVTNPK